MAKESRRSGRSNHRLDQDYQSRDVSDRGRNVSKTEAIEIMAQFSPDGGTGEYASQQMCLQIIKSLSELARMNLMDVDIPLLERGYTHLPKRWNVIQSSIESPHSYSEALNDEIIYFRHCYTALGTGR